MIWKFPDDVPGWLTEAEGWELATLATGKVCLEIGSYCGRSAICMAQTAESLCCVDPFDGRATASPGATQEAFVGNALRYGVASRIGIVRGLSRDAHKAGMMPRMVDFAFVDGAHDYRSVITDAGICLERLHAGSLIGFHDYASGIDPGVTEAVDELIGAGRLKLLRVVDSLVVCERC